MSKVEIVITTPAQALKDFAALWRRVEAGQQDITPRIGFGSPSELLTAITDKPLCDPTLRQLILDIKAKNELTIDHVSQDLVLEAGFSQAALDRARGLVQSFEQFIADHKDEITALQILYSLPYKQRLTFESVKELADKIEAPPYLWNESQL